MRSKPFPMANVPCFVGAPICGLFRSQMTCDASKFNSLSKFWSVELIVVRRASVLQSIIIRLSLLLRKVTF